MSRVSDMLDKILAQYGTSETMKYFFEAVAEELDLIDNATTDLKEKRWIDTGEGVQLDGIGTIVDRSRVLQKAIPLQFFGFEGQASATGFSQARFRSYLETYLSSATLSDAEYRLVLWSKVSKNNSLCYFEDTISALQFVFNANTVIVQDADNARYIVGIGKVLSQNEIILANSLDLLVRAGGVKCDFMTNFDADNVFGFSNQKIALGFNQGSFANTFYQ